MNDKDPRHFAATAPTLVNEPIALEEAASIVGRCVREMVVLKGRELIEVHESLQATLRTVRRRR